MITKGNVDGHDFWVVMKMPNDQDKRRQMILATQPSSLARPLYLYLYLHLHRLVRWLAVVELFA